MTGHDDTWIKLARKLREHPRFTDGDWLKVWIWLLTSVTYRERKAVFQGKEIALQPGQIITGRHRIAQETGVSQGKVWRVLETLKIEQQIEQLSSNRNSLISIVNWSRYQQAEQPDEQQLSSQRAASEQQLSTYQEGKKVQEGKKEGKKSEGESPIPPAPPLKTPKAKKKSEGRIFKPPTREELAAYAVGKYELSEIEQEKLLSHYEANGWVQGSGQKIKSWEATVRSWVARRKENPGAFGKPASSPAPQKMTQKELLNSML